MVIQGEHHLICLAYLNDKYIGTYFVDERDLLCDIDKFPLPVSRAQIESAMVYSSAASVKRFANTPDIKQAFVCL